MKHNIYGLGVIRLYVYVDLIDTLNIPLDNGNLWKAGYLCVGKTAERKTLCLY